MRDISSFGTEVAAQSTHGAEPEMAYSTAKQLSAIQRWSVRDIAFFGAEQTHDTLPAGVYRAKHHHEMGAHLEKMKIEADDLLTLPDAATETVLSEFQQFWKLKSEFTQRGFVHKRGILLWGPPGSGKTSSIQLMMKAIVQDLDGVVLFIEHPVLGSACLQLMRKIEPERPLVVIMEDIDALVMRHGESEFLAMLDGEAQVGNVVFVATTNYPERLDKRFVDRPSRFDVLQYVGMPSVAARRQYLMTKEPTLEGAELDAWVRDSDGFSIAHLREMIIANRCFGHSIDNVIGRLDDMRVRRPSSEDAPDKKRVGFGR